MPIRTFAAPMRHVTFMAWTIPIGADILDPNTEVYP